MLGFIHANQEIAMQQVADSMGIVSLNSESKTEQGKALDENYAKIIGIKLLL